MTERAREVGDLMQLATLFERSVDAIYVRTPADIITRWDPSAEKLYGYTAEEAIGRHVSIILPPGSEGELHLIREMVFRRGQPLIFETRRRRKDGSVIEVSLSVTPLRSPEGRVLGVVTIARDITSSKQEAALIHAIVDATPAALLAVDEAGRILLASARAEGMLGYARGELNWKSVEDLVPERLRVKHSSCGRVTPRIPARGQWAQGSIFALAGRTGARSRWRSA